MTCFLAGKTSSFCHMEKEHLHRVRKYFAGFFEPFSLGTDEGSLQNNDACFLRRPRKRFTLGIIRRAPDSCGKQNNGQQNTTTYERRGFRRRRNQEKKKRERKFNKKQLEKGNTPPFSASLWGILTFRPKRRVYAGPVDQSVPPSCSENPKYRSQAKTAPDEASHSSASLNTSKDLQASLCVQDSQQDMQQKAAAQDAATQLYARFLADMRKSPEDSLVATGTWVEELSEEPQKDPKSPSLLEQHSSTRKEEDAGGPAHVQEEKPGPSQTNSLGQNENSGGYLDKSSISSSQSFINLVDFSTKSFPDGTSSKLDTYLQTWKPKVPSKPPINTLWSEASPIKHQVEISRDSINSEEILECRAEGRGFKSRFPKKKAEASFHSKESANTLATQGPNISDFFRFLEVSTDLGASETVPNDNFADFSGNFVASFESHVKPPSSIQIQDEGGDKPQSSTHKPELGTTIKKGNGTTESEQNFSSDDEDEKVKQVANQTLDEKKFWHITGKTSSKKLSKVSNRHYYSGFDLNIPESPGPSNDLQKSECFPSDTCSGVDSSLWIEAPRSSGNKILAVSTPQNSIVVKCQASEICGGENSSIHEDINNSNPVRDKASIVSHMQAKHGPKWEPLTSQTPFLRNDGSQEDVSWDEFEKVSENFDKSKFFEVCNNSRTQPDVREFLGESSIIIDSGIPDSDMSDFPEKSTSFDPFYSPKASFSPKNLFYLYGPESEDHANYDESE